MRNTTRSPSPVKCKSARSEYAAQLFMIRVTEVTILSFILSTASLRLFKIMTFPVIYLFSGEIRFLENAVSSHQVWVPGDRDEINLQHLICNFVKNRLDSYLTILCYK